MRLAETTSTPDAAAGAPTSTRHGVRPFPSPSPPLPVPPATHPPNPAPADTGILTKNIDDNYSSTVQTYASALITRIKSGSYRSLTSSWLSCTSTTTPAASRRFLGPLGSLSSDSSPFSAETEGTLEGDVKRLVARAASLDAGIDEWADHETDSLVGRAPAPAATITPLACPLVWAKEANAYCCVRPVSFLSFPPLLSDLD